VQFFNLQYYHKERDEMKKQKRYLYLNNEEYSVVLHSLISFKNKLIQQGRYTDCIDDTIIKVVDAPNKVTKKAI
jgi:hypothetical protein